MATNYVATADGVLLKVDDRVVSLYRGGAAPSGADQAHVALLLDRGLLVEASEDDQGAPEEDHSSSDDTAAADKAAASKSGSK